MALITCPECNHQVSDRAASCPHCGYPFAVEESNVMITPINTESNPECRVEVAPSSPNKKRIILISVICAVILAIIGSVIALIVIKDKQDEARQQELARQEELAKKEAEARTEYIENLNEFVLSALFGGADAEKLCNLTKSVWYDTIYEEYNSETAPYTQTNGKFHDDFNTSLAKLYSSSSYLKSVADIKDNRNIVDELYKKLLNPDDEFQKCFEEVEALYSAYYDLTKLAISPSGSLKSYSEDLSEFDKEFISHYDKLKLLIPEE